MKESENRKILSDLRAAIEAKYGGRGHAVVNARFVAAVRDLDQDLKDEAVAMAAGTLQRSRDSVRDDRGLRVSVPTERNGVQMSLPFLKLTIAEARSMRTRETAHAEASAYRRDYDAFAIELAEERCRERGLDPDSTTHALEAFISAQEVAEMWARRHQATSNSLT